MVVIAGGKVRSERTDRVNSESVIDRDPDDHNVPIRRVRHVRNGVVSCEGSIRRAAAPSRQDGMSSRHLRVTFPVARGMRSSVEKQRQ